MTPQQARELEPGDLVSHPDWPTPRAVEHVNSDNFHLDPMVFFVKGGFWRASALRKVKA